MQKKWNFSNQNGSHFGRFLGRGDLQNRTKRKQTGHLTCPPCRRHAHYQLKLFVTSLVVCLCVCVSVIFPATARARAPKCMSQPTHPHPQQGYTGYKNLPLFLPQRPPLRMIFFRKFPIDRGGPAALR